MTTRKAPPHAWPKGTSGNPRGRAPGSGEVAKLRAAIAEHVPAIIQQLVGAALQGDVAAARLLLERTIAPLKAAEPAAPLVLPDGSLTEQGRAVLGAVAAGTLAPGQGAALLAGIGTLARVVELDDLARRVALLEGKGGPRDEAA